MLLVLGWLMDDAGRACLSLARCLRAAGCRSHASVVLEPESPISIQCTCIRCTWGLRMRADVSLLPCETGRDLDLLHCLHRKKTHFNVGEQPLLPAPSTSMPSPDQPTIPLAPEEIDACVKLVRSSSFRFSGGSPAVMTYATSIKPGWMLGTSAVLQGSPIVLVGLGRRGWQWCAAAVVAPRSTPPFTRASPCQASSSGGLVVILTRMPQPSLPA